MIGDVIFFRKDKSFISRMIALFTQSEYSHVAIIISENLDGSYEIIESDRFVNTRRNTLILDENKHVIYTVEGKTDEQIESIVKYAKKSIGRKYDYFQIVGILISILFKTKRYKLFNNINRLICSELVDLSYFKSGVKRLTNWYVGNVTPQELLLAYNFKIREGA